MEAISRKNKGGILRALRWVLLLMVLAVLGFVLFMAAQLWDLDAWQDFDPANILGAQQSLILYDGENGEILRLHDKEDRVSIPLSDVPDLVQKAFISAEDARFYEHPGVDVIRIVGAAWADIKAT